MNREAKAYVTRRAQGWPCPHPARFSMLVVHATYDVMVQMSGVLDHDAVTAFTACVTAAIRDCPRQVVLAVGALEDLDEAGVMGFASVVRDAEVQGIGVVLESPSEVVLSRLRATDRLQNVVVRS